MSQSILIIAISLIAAVIVGSIVFFVWTFLQKLFSRPSAKETAGATDNEQEEQPAPAGEEAQEG